jgi:hypothetical protein
MQGISFNFVADAGLPWLEIAPGRIVFTSGDFCRSRRTMKGKRPETWVAMEWFRTRRADEDGDADRAVAGGPHPGRTRETRRARIRTAGATSHGQSTAEIRMEEALDLIV